MDLISQHEYPLTRLFKIGNTTMRLIIFALFYFILEFKNIAIIPYLNIWKFLFFERIFIGIYIYIYIYVKLKLVRGLTSFNFFR